MLLTCAALVSACLPAADFPHGEEWQRRFAAPEGFAFRHKTAKVKTEKRDGFTLETWRQANGPKSFQDVLVAVPQGAKGCLPAVVIPADEKGDSGFFWVALSENAKSKVGCTRRYSRTDIKKLRQVDVDELYIFLDDYVRNAVNPPKAYSDVGIRLAMVQK